MWTNDDPAGPQGLRREVRDTARDTARERLGLPELRPAQLAAIDTVMAGRDVLVVLPTGAGKSAIYQVPGLLRDGPTVVVSPLISLQRDQIASLEGQGGPGMSAIAVDGSMSKTQRGHAFERIAERGADFVFVTPEQLADPELVQTLRAAEPSLLAVDEAHCVSVWGHDFRPDYLLLGRFMAEVGAGGRRPPIVGLTATASPPVRADIIERLGMVDPHVVAGDLDRPNIALSVMVCATEEAREQRLLEIIPRLPTPGLVYCATRKSAEQSAQMVRDKGLRADAYHAGMARGQRDAVQTAFMDGEVDVLTATSAFGMGIDKPDIRFVIHLALPDSPDSYYQEVGRAGRDGQPAHGILVYRPEDAGLRRYQTGGLPSVADAEAVAAAAAQTPSRQALAQATGLPARRITRILALLEQVGALRLGRQGRLTVPPGAPSTSDAARMAIAAADRHRTVARTRVLMMLHYADAKGCRTRFLLNYLGDQETTPCGHCDICAEGGQVTARDAAYLPHTRVRHETFGDGTVLGQESGEIIVLFDSSGYRKLDADIVRDTHLLATLG